MIYRDRDIVREIAGLTPPEIIEKVIYLYKANPSKEERKEIVDNVNKALVDLSNAGQKAGIISVNNVTKQNKSFSFFEGRDINIQGTGVPLSNLEIEMGEARSRVFVTVNASGTWSTVIPDKLLGYNTYTVSARTVVDGMSTGARNEIGKVTIIPWWWFIAALLIIFVSAQAYKLKKRADQIKELTKIIVK